MELFEIHFAQRAVNAPKALLIATTRQKTVNIIGPTNTADQLIE